MKKSDGGGGKGSGAVFPGLFHKNYRTPLEICPPMQALARYFEVVLAETTALFEDQPRESSNSAVFSGISTKNTAPHLKLTHLYKLSGGILSCFWRKIPRFLKIFFILLAVVRYFQAFFHKNTAPFAPFPASFPSISYSLFIFYKTFNRCN